MVHAKTAEDSDLIQTEIRFDNCKQYETEQLGGSRNTINSHNKREMIFSNPIQRVFTVHELSKFLLYTTYYIKLQPFAGESNFESQ